MRVPLKWLDEYCVSGMSVDELAERLAMTGTEVERVTRNGSPSNENFVVGRVISADQHPDADRLRVCTVDVGEDQPSTIVCGAPNVADGQTVAVVRPGAIMPGGDKLKKAKLRGVESFGMILAEDEIEIGGDHDGIMVLSDEPNFDANSYAPGTPLEDVLLPGEDVLELEITPNRPDCLGVFGIAREVHAITGNPLSELPGAPPINGAETFDIAVENEELCPRFTARILRGVQVGQSPLWLKQRLSAAGQRPINNVVDITNYAMLLTGQPMHAFDLDKIRGGKLIVRNAVAGEKVTTLDGVEREVDEQTLLVCDADGPSAIAGIMGGAVSEVSTETTNVLLEIATWNGPNIHRTSQLLGLRSEASGRFEKGLSAQLPLEVQEVASALFVQLTGATLASDTIDIACTIPVAPPITLRGERVTGLLGAEIPIARCAEILERLDFDVKVNGDDLETTPPHYRAADVTREADLIEEVARIEGVDKFPATLPSVPTAIGRLTGSQRLKRGFEDFCADNGYHEVITWSFTSEATLAKLAPGNDFAGEALAIANPLSADQAIMRPAVLPGLLEVAQHNFARGAEGVRLFELGKTYKGTADDPLEQTMLAFLLSGEAVAKSWRNEPEAGDFYALKGMIEGLARIAGVTIAFTPVSAEMRPYLIPGRSAELSIGEQKLGYVGEVHPLVLKQFNLTSGVAAEIDVDQIAASLPATVTYQQISSFPPAREDIAVVVSQDVPAEEVLSIVKASGGKLLKDATVFDVYTGEQVGDGKKSLAIRLTYSASDRTLTDEETSKARAAITKKLEEFGGALRA